MIRYILALVLTFLPATQLAFAQNGERAYTDMPVMVLYCDEDPGRINPAGGKDPSPHSLVQDGFCTPAEGVAVTFVLAEDDWDFETDDLAEEIDWDVEDDGWFNRCDTDADGMCDLNSPTGFDIVLGVVLHENTVLPGYEPAFFQSTTHNYTEFAGWGLVLTPSSEGPIEGATTADHQTLALNITQDGEPANILTEWEFNHEDDDIYLATNADGWVSNIVAASDMVEIDLVNVDDDATITVACAANDDASVTVEPSVNDDGDVHITIPDTESDIRCDISVAN